MQPSHTFSPASIAFDDPNLVAAAGLAPVMALAERCGLAQSAADTLSVPSPNAALKTGGLVGQASHTPVLSNADRVCVVDVDDTVKPTNGYAKQGAGYGHTHVKGLNALIGTVSTPTVAPVIAAARLRKDGTNSVRGGASFVAATLATAKRCGASGLIFARADSAFYTAEVAAAIRRAGARLSITARQTPAVKRAIVGIDEDAWTPIRYPNALWGADDTHPSGGYWVCDAEVAETSYTAFTNHPQLPPVTARADRASGQAQTTGRAERAGRRLPVPPGVHPLADAHVAGRDLSPGPRHRRAGDGRPQSRPARAPPIGPVRGERCGSPWPRWRTT